MYAKRPVINSLIILFLVFANCGFYTFNQNSVPGHLSTVDIPLFTNQSSQPRVADNITTRLSQEFITRNLLRVVSQNGDATLAGRVVTYNNTPYNYGAAGVRQVVVSQYVVRITADIDFFDNKKNVPLYRGTITGEGIYDVNTENEDIGRERAEKEIVRKVMENSFQSW